MTTPTTGEHFSATINVPKDAYSLDFVFSEMEEGGEFDNRGGLDYHLPVEGAGRLIHNFETCIDRVFLILNPRNTF